jgi:Tfp pilus assembly protein PilF
MVAARDDVSAIGLLKEALSFEPGSPRILVAYGGPLYRLGRKQESLEAFRQALEAYHSGREDEPGPHANDRVRWVEEAVRALEAGKSLPFPG